MGRKPRTRSKAVSSSLAALAFIIVLIAGLVVAGLMLARWRVAEQHYEERGERIVSMAREVVKMRIQYLAEDAGNQTIIRPIIYLKSGWMGESRLTHILVIARDGGIIVDADVDIRVAPMETLKLKPSDLHPSLAKYDSDYEALQSEVKLIILHTSLGNVVSAAPPTGEYEVINMGPTETLILTSTITNTTTVTGGGDRIIGPTTVVKSRCWTTRTRSCKKKCIGWTTGVKTITKEKGLAIQYCGRCYGFDADVLVVACNAPCGYDYCVLYAEVNGEKKSASAGIGSGQAGCACEAYVGPFDCPSGADAHCSGKAVKKEVVTTKICTKWRKSCGPWKTLTKCTIWKETSTTTYELQWMPWYTTTLCRVLTGCKNAGRCEVRVIYSKATEHGWPVYRKSTVTTCQAGEAGNITKCRPFYSGEWCFVEVGGKVKPGYDYLIIKAQVRDHTRTASINLNGVGKEYDKWICIARKKYCRDLYPSGCEASACRLTTTCWVTTVREKASTCPLTFISLGAAGLSAMAPILLLMRRAGRRAGVRETWPKPR